MAWIVNGEMLDEAVIREEARLVHAKLLEAMTDEDPLALQMRAWEWARENVIERVLLRQAAVHDPAPLPDGMVEHAMQTLSSEQRRMLPDAGPDFERQVEIQLRVERLVSVLTSTVPAVSNREAAEYYKKHRESFFAPEMVRAAHIVKNVA